MNDTKGRWDRVRFKANLPDYRPVTFPPPGPFWCSGEGDDYSIIVAYFPHPVTNSDIRKFWPEARAIDVMNENTTLTYSDRFKKPHWYKD